MCRLDVIMSSKEENSNLRDQIAIAAMQSFIAEYGKDFGLFIDDHLKEITEDNVKTLENIAELSYKMADFMRKARLQTFT